MRIFKYLVIALFAVFYISFGFSFSKSSAQVKPDDEITEKVTIARTETDNLFKQIRGVLMEQLKNGNFAEATEVCAKTAQEMTKNYAEANGIDIRRVSLKYRNPLNRPDKFEKRQLKTFERNLKENNAPTDSYEVVTIGNKRFIRYMKPIIFQEGCLKCHGNSEQIPAEVKKILVANYPKDKATGYKVGDVRGAFSVRIPLK